MEFYVKQSVCKNHLFSPSCFTDGHEAESTFGMVKRRFAPWRLYSSAECTSLQKFIQTNSRLGNRGPDASGIHTIGLTSDAKLTFCGYVLHLRGTDLVRQPAVHHNGDVLLWNAEVFGGVQVDEDECDTQVVLDTLASCVDEDTILSTLGKIQGPWSFIYWQESSQSLWFGRDVFGRRSLLWHLPDSENDALVLSSVQILPWDFQEVPSVGIYRLKFKSEGQGHSLTLFPWQRAVWPGTLDPVTKDSLSRLYQGKEPLHLVIDLREKQEVVSQMPQLNKTIPSDDWSLPLTPDLSHLQYLQKILKDNEFLRSLSAQLTSVLQQAVKTRVENQTKTHHCITGKQTSTTYARRHSNKSSCTDSAFPSEAENNSTSCGHGKDSAGIGANGSCDNNMKCDDEAVGGANWSPDIDLTSCDFTACDSHVIVSPARVAILFSGGIDSAVIAALADRVVPSNEPIDLINVAFEQKPKTVATVKKYRSVRKPHCWFSHEAAHFRPKEVPVFDKWGVPDRLTGYTALGELNPQRHWNFIEVNVTAEELQQTRSEHIQHFVYPLNTVLDDSIGCAVWFAARGQGVLGNGPDRGKPIVSTSRVILCGMGADEQLIGYSRHRGRFQSEGWEGLINEIELEITRISARNLGRDDRIITDHGKESRFPFLDERVVGFLSSLPIYHKADLTLPRGLGEKLLLRLAAVQLGLCETATQPKRAIQFGSRIAKMENSKEKASDACDRLNNVVKHTCLDSS